MAIKCRVCGGILGGVSIGDHFKCRDCSVLVADANLFFGKPDIIIPPIPPPPPPPPPIIPPDAEYMDKPAKKAGWPTRYGFDDKSFSGGTVKLYILPIGRLYPSGQHQRIQIETYNLGIPAGGDIGLKLTSPEGFVQTSDSPTTSDESLSVRAMGDQQPNYPCSFITKGDWTLEITAKVSSRVRIWWYLPY